MSDYKSESAWLMKGDCLERMKEIESGSVDMILTDPPYGTTACKWDSIIPLELMWDQLKRIIKPNGAIVMTASQPFTTALIASNMKMFKYCWVWEKSRPTDFPNANNKPMKKHEDILVFSAGTTANGSHRKMLYNPQGLVRRDQKVKRTSRGFQGERPKQTDEYVSKYTNYPNTIIPISSEGKTVHPTQKPVALMEYLIKTYTNEGETVLDFTMGSGSTGVAANNLNRSFIGIELDQGYFEVAKERINGKTII
ncbi:DNA methylase, partial [Vibrio phage 1.007.O._10N.261.55.F9]